MIQILADKPYEFVPLLTKILNEIAEQEEPSYVIAYRFPGDEETSDVRIGYHNASPTSLQNLAQAVMNLGTLKMVQCNLDNIGIEEDEDETAEL